MLMPCILGYKRDIVPFLLRMINVNQSIFKRFYQGVLERLGKICQHGTEIL